MTPENEKPKLIVILGPTGVGKTAVSVKLAQKLNCPIISADSRQIYKGLRIGTAAPSPKELQTVKHYFIGHIDPTEYYSASRFEKDTIALLAKLHQTHKHVIMCGGSMLYIDAVCNGIDEIPDIPPTLRKQLKSEYQEKGIEPILNQLQQLDPVFYDQIDRQNHKRVIHALEICIATGLPYSTLRRNEKKQRPFDIIKIGLTRERAELYERINNRVDQMLTDGLIEEARQLYPLRHLNALDTVGYKELFNYFSGNCTLDFAIEKIKQNSRIYSRKQMTWFKRDPEIKWVQPEEEQDILNMF